VTICSQCSIHDRRGDRPRLGGVVALAAAQRRADLVRAVGAFESPMPWLEWWRMVSAGGRR